MALLQQILLQAFYYFVAMLLVFIAINFLLRGFLIKFLRVKFSLGKLKLVKIRNIDYDDFAIGSLDEAFICFKYHKKAHRLPLPRDVKIFYRVLNTSWIDIDGVKWAVCGVDYEPVSSHDPVKTENYIKRILQAPKSDDKTLRIILFIQIGLIVMIIVILAMLFFQGQRSDKIVSILQQVYEYTRPAVSPAPNL